MATKTLRPLKKGDKCWIRIQRDPESKPVLAVYDEHANKKEHWVKVGNITALCHSEPRKGYNCCLMGYPDAIFVAKPIPEGA